MVDSLFFWGKIAKPDKERGQNLIKLKLHGQRDL